METTKTITRTFAIMDRPFEQMGEMSAFHRPAGDEFRIGTGYWYIGAAGELRHRHGVYEPIPAEYFHLEVEEEVHTVTTTRRRA